MLEGGERILNDCYNWQVYSTSVEDRTILVEDRNSGKRGCVVNPSLEEWAQAFHAPSCPYSWPHPERVIVDE